MTAKPSEPSGDDWKCFLLLSQGDELCGSREIPMPSNVIKEVREIYEKCKNLLISNQFGDTPLTNASRFGLKNMVWGFIQYGKQTNTNPHTYKTWELQTFLGYKNSSGQTALDMAIEKGFYDMVEAFGLEDVSWQDLITDRNHDGKTLLSLLSNHEYDEIIFKAMKAAGKGKVDSSISISVDEDNHQVDQHVAAVRLLNYSSYVHGLGNNRINRNRTKPETFIKILKPKMSRPSEG